KAAATPGRRTCAARRSPSITRRNFLSPRVSFSAERVTLGPSEMSNYAGTFLPRPCRRRREPRRRRSSGVGGTPEQGSRKKERTRGTQEQHKRNTRGAHQSNWLLPGLQVALTR